MIASLSSENELFGLKLVDPKPVRKSPPDHRVWLLTGDSWSVWRDGYVYMMQYQSGEHGGGLRAIAIEDDDFVGLRDGTTTCDRVLSQHHAS